MVVVGFRAQPAADIGARLLQDAAVRVALTAARARVFADEFRALGLANVRIDKEG